MSTKGYNVEFDISLKSGNKENKSESQFIVVSTLPYNITANAAYSGTDYLFSLSMGQFTGDGYKTTWYINDLTNSTGTTKTLEYTKWYHVKLVVTATSVAYTITDNSTSTVVHSASKTVTSMPTMKGFFSLNGYGGGFVKFDNLEIYDYSSLPAMTKLWGQDYRIITKEQKNMEPAEGDATCSNAISAGESFYWVPSLNGTSAAANANVGFYCKKSNGRQWRIANTSSGKCYQGIANVSSTSTVHIYNLKKGQIVKVGGFDDDASALYNGAGVLTALTNYDNGAVRFYEVNADGTGELTISSSWAYVYFVEVFEPDYEIVGMLDKSTGFLADKKDFTLSKGQAINVSFVNHGLNTQNFYNWIVRMNNTTTGWQTLRADNVVLEAGDVYTKSLTKNGSPMVDDDAFWSQFRTDMNDASVVMTVDYSLAGMLSVTATATAAGSGNVYVHSYAYKTAISENVSVELGIEKAWLEILSSAQVVPVTISAAGYATFSSPYPLDFSKATSGLEAYMITGHEGNAITKTQVTGTVPAGTGLLLKGAAGDYNIPVVASSTTDVSANLMKAGDGTSISSESGKTKYVLGVNNNGTTEDTSDDFAEFQKIVSTPATVPTGKAYLQFNEAISVKSLSFIDDGKATGVDAPVAAEAEGDGIYYNLNGQQVTKDYKGIVIVNGKKFFNK